MFLRVRGLLLGQPFVKSRIISRFRTRTLNLLNLETRKDVNTQSEEQEIERAEAELETLDSVKECEYRELSARSKTERTPKKCLTAQ